MSGMPNPTDINQPFELIRNRTSNALAINAITRTCSRQLDRIVTPYTADVVTIKCWRSTVRGSGQTTTAGRVAGAHHARKGRIAVAAGTGVC
jgi:hypothetical protein